MCINLAGSQKTGAATTAGSSSSVRMTYSAYPQARQRLTSPFAGAPSGRSEPTAGTSSRPSIKPPPHAGHVFIDTAHFNVRATLGRRSLASSIAAIPQQPDLLWRALSGEWQGTIDHQLLGLHCARSAGAGTALRHRRVVDGVEVEVRGSRSPSRSSGVFIRSASASCFQPARRGVVLMRFCPLGDAA